jgi:hypothetical protein
MSAKRVLALIGSPRQKNTSGVLADRVLERLAGQGWETERIWIRRAVRNAERQEELVRQFAAADLVILACPLYVDSLPADTTLTLERLARECTESPSPSKGFVAILNCGFVEARHNDIALAICRQFAREAGITWLGGLAIGGGGMIDAQPLEKLGSRCAPLVRALDLSADAFARGVAIPEEAEQLARKRTVPGWMYRAFAHWGMKRSMRKHGCLARARAKPYLRT